MFRIFNKSAPSRDEYEFKKWYKFTWLSIDVTIKYSLQETAKGKFKTAKEMHECVDNILAALITQASKQDSLSVDENYKTAIVNMIGSLDEKLKESGFMLVRYQIKPRGTDCVRCTTFSGPVSEAELEAIESKVAQP